jgi:hypothetical protein
VTGRRKAFIHNACVCCIMSIDTPGGLCSLLVSVANSTQIVESSFLGLARVIQDLRTGNIHTTIYWEPYIVIARAVHRPCHPS